MNINDAVILITGGTGSFGNAFVQQTLKKFHPRKLIIFSRDEMKQWEMAKTFGSDERIRFCQLFMNGIKTLLALKMGLRLIRISLTQVKIILGGCQKKSSTNGFMKI